MSEQGDLDELARRYLDLWQDQMTALASDPEIAEAMERVLRQWMGTDTWPGPFAGGHGGAAAHPGAPGTSPGQAPPFAFGWPAAMMTALQAAMQPGSGPADRAAQGTGDGRNGTGATPGGPGAQDGTTTAAGPSGGGSVDLDQLLRRLAALEQRLAALEGAEPAAGSRGKTGKPKAGGRKRRT